MLHLGSLRVWRLEHQKLEISHPCEFKCFSEDTREFRGLNFKCLRFQMLVSSNTSSRMLESLDA